MTLIRYFDPIPEKDQIPQRVISPFNKTPDPLAWRAGLLLQAWLRQQTDFAHDFEAEDGGKMFGVLVVQDDQGGVGYLSAFSGMLAGHWQLAGFVPPVFDQAERDTFLPAGEERLAQYAVDICDLSQSANRRALQVELEALREQQDIELQAMKALHKKRKAQRHVQRLKFSANKTDDQEREFKQLACESQKDKREYKNLLANWRLRLAPIQQTLETWQEEIELLKKARNQLSKKLHRQVFAGYSLVNKLGEQRLLSSFFENKQPPGGAGDCAGAKLVHYAIQHDLIPLAMAEFWWGAPPKDTIRHHGHYYPACRGKCHPILPFMLKGYDVLPRQVPGGRCQDETAPHAVYEDQHVLVVNKPSGLLSVPGKEIEDSVLTRIKKRYPEATGPLLVHRLDLATSGLLLVAKDLKTHKALQRQFIKRTIEKRYVALLSKQLNDDEGVIELPLRVDLDDRPRHMVCFQFGKAAMTRWQVVSRTKETTRVYFYPVTGRTHQLRIHSAHPQGLNAPIVGDELYGEKAERLLLHAEKLTFTHPVTGKRITVEQPVPF